GRTLHGTGSPLFFGFPRATDFRFFEAAPNPESSDRFELRTQRARPSYIEDSVVGGNFKLGPKQFKFEGNVAAFLRGSQSEDQIRCIAADDGRTQEDCEVEFPAFSNPEVSRSHDQLINFGGAITVPEVEDLVAGYLEVVGQRQAQGAVTALNPDGTVQREDDHWGYGIYGNLNFDFGPVKATLEAKHYQGFSPPGSNIDLATRGFSAPEYNNVVYNRVPTAESIYIQFIGSPNVCNTGGRLRLDYVLADEYSVYGWVGRYRSFTEADANNFTCSDSGPNGERVPELQTDTWDGAMGVDFGVDGGRSHYNVWVGARSQNHPEPIEFRTNQFSTIFYRESYARYSITQQLVGDFSLSAQGFHQIRFEPALLERPWNEGENYLSLNWNPHWSFIFGQEYLTRPGFPQSYFSGAIQYRSKSLDTWYDRLTDKVLVYFGQRRAALRCIGGVCRLYPPFEGGKVEIVSRF
ncbi:MAG: DUF6029 family protein, partial [Myxococcota bacterium]